MVRTYWLVQVFNEASWNLGLQPDRTDDQVESDSAPRYVQAILASTRRLADALQVGRGHVLLAVLRRGVLEALADRLEHRQVEAMTLDRFEDEPGVLRRQVELEGGLEALLDHHLALQLGVGVVDRAARDHLEELAGV